MQFNQGFIGYVPNQPLRFLGSDKEKTFSDNLKKLSDDWYYRTAEITYTHNSLGHRSIEPKNLNLDNYILFTGCSHTEGIGLELEKTYPYLVADELGCDYYSLALGGTGIDVMMYNLSLWLIKVKERPKAIVVQWPNEARFLLVNGLVNDLSPIGVWNSGEEVSRFMVAGSFSGFFSSRKKIAQQFINSVSNDAKIINIICEDNENTENFIRIPDLDRARDLMHAGMLSNRYLADCLVRQLS